MKYFFLFFFLTSALFLSNSQVKNAVKINLFSPIVHTGSVYYERILSGSSSINLGFLYTRWGFSDSDIKGYAITSEYRYYLAETAAPEGFYIAPYVRYQNLLFTKEDSGNEAKFTGIGGGLLVGRQWLFKQIITFDLFIGPSYINGDFDIKSEDGEEDDFDSGFWNGFGVRSGVTLGFAF